MQKIYAYTDETGQDTEGKLFLVSVVIPDKERKKLRQELRRIEKESGKRKRKWTKATREQRKKYIREIMKRKNFANCGFISEYEDTKAYVDLTILTTAKAILKKAKQPYKAIVYVDGLTRNERNRFAAGLRNLHIRVSKVRGIRDEADEFIRLADAIAGFVRDVLEDDEEMEWIYKKAIGVNFIKKI